MRTVILGKKSPLAVSAVGLGCVGMVSAYPPIPEKKDMVRFAREAFAKGETFFDTAEVYGPYTSEEILGEALRANQELLDFLETQAKKKGCTMAQLALAWILAKRPWIVPIPGTTKLNRLEENIGAANVKFTSDELTALNEKLDRIQIYGARYNAQQESMVEK